ncbi:unnamed protein product [Tilletia laevis]|uniref:CENP-C homolog n=3 Tax=Tilletia TaxID=13289 RepID=A0A8X7MPC7_9BASI|nr:hypothetical protein CF336_g7275 [Tilletia laevis]KAE8192868.1 hypothetical protein CF328_g5221 [Tilletia controversa]KAE8256996.1 hypothetical protein A4X03_0g4850 [Tilletia caries]KAE8196574.1 hypothetical protein CF335_g4824 [Tilletia laevis]KAE8243972.1 hypothetical protein A4X06_0g6032 [Tilletia controversa]
MSNRRFYEENVGARTGIRIPSINRNSRGFEDTDQFFNASKNKMAARRAVGGAQADEEDDVDDNEGEEEEEEEEEDYDDTRDQTGDEDGPDRQSADEDASSLANHQPDATDDGEQTDDDDAVEGQIFSGVRPASAQKGRDSRAAAASMGESSAMDLEESDAPSPQTALRLAQGAARKARGPTTPSFLNDKSRTPRRGEPSSPEAHTPGTAVRAPSRMSVMSTGRNLDFDSTIDGYDDTNGGKGARDLGDAPPIFLYDDDDGPGSTGSGIQNLDRGASPKRTRLVNDEDDDEDEEEEPPQQSKRRSSGKARASDASASRQDEEQEETPQRGKRRSSGGGRSSNASASRSSVGGSSLAASMGRRAFNRVRHTASMSPNKSLELEQQQTPSRSSVSQPSPTKSVASSVSSADGRALEFNDYGDDDNGGYIDPGYDNEDETGNDNDNDNDGDRNDTAGGLQVIVEEDVGEEALDGTTAGQADHEMFSPRRDEAKKSPNQKGKGKGKQKEKDPKGKRRARSEESENEPNGIQVDRVIVQRNRAPLGQQKQVHEIHENIPASFHLRGFGGADESTDGSGPRRGKRLRFAPLEWWRGEHAEFGRVRLPDISERDDEDDDNEEEGARSQAGEDDFEARPSKEPVHIPVPVLQRIVRIQRAPGEGTFSGMSLPRKNKGGKKKAAAPKAKDEKKRKAARSGSESEEGDEEEIRFDERGYTIQPEDGWDEETDQMGLVWNVDTGEEVTRRIACQRSEVKTRKVFNSDFKFEKVFGVDDFMAAGVIEVPVGGSKPVKPSKTNSYTFIVNEGAVRVRIHRSNFVMGPGGMFLVPKGNTYSIENIAKRDARLFFAQARDPNLDPEQARGVVVNNMVNNTNNGSQSMSMAGPSGSQYAAAATAVGGGGGGGRGRKAEYADGASMTSPANKRAKK